MIGMLRLGVIGLIALSVIYVLVSVYSKSVHREKLEKKWDSEVKTGDRDAYVEQGMQDYDGSLRKKLVLLVFAVPVVAVVGLTYVTNFL